MFILHHTTTAFSDDNLWQRLSIWALVISFFSFLKNILAVPQNMWNLSSPARDQTHAPAVEMQSLNHWAAREVSVAAVTFTCQMNKSRQLTKSHCLRIY